MDTEVAWTIWIIALICIAIGIMIAFSLGYGFIFLGVSLLLSVACSQVYKKYYGN